MNHPTSNPEQLLAHDDFVVGLSRSLLGKDGQDLAQEAYARSLRSPPPGNEHAARAWWSSVVRRLASNFRRGERRRRAREAVVSEAQRVHSQASPTPAEVLAREEVRTEVVHAVLALPEPFREVVLLRFYEDLTAPQIAARLDLPQATVRTRLKRGLDRLRVALDDQHGGTREAWATALLPWAIGSQAAGHVGWWSGAFAMKKTVTAAVLATASLLLGLATWLWNQGGEPAVPASVGDVATVDGDSTPKTTPSSTAPGTREERQPSAPADIAAYPIERRNAAIHGVTIDDGGAIVAGATLTLTPWVGLTLPEIPFVDDRTFERRTTSDANGRFTFAHVPEGPCRLRARAAGLAGTSRLVVASPEHERQVIAKLHAVPAEVAPAILVYVQDEAGRKLQDVPVECYFHSKSSDAKPYELSKKVLTTDKNGRIEHPYGQEGVAIARTSDGRLAKGILGHHHEVVLTVRTPLTLTGSLTGASATMLAGSEVRLHAGMGGGPIPARTWTTPVRGTSFAFEDMPPGHYFITLHSPRGLRLARKDERTDHWQQTHLLELGNDQANRRDYEVAVGGQIQGTVVTDSGAPVVGAHVTARVLSAMSPRLIGSAKVMHFNDRRDFLPRMPQSQFEAVTDIDGSYVLPGMPAGSYRVEVRAPRLSIDSDNDVVVRDGESTGKRHVLHAAGALQIATIDSSIVGVAPIAKPAHPLMAAWTASGKATFTGLPAGRYSVVAYVGGNSTPRPLKTVTIVAGRTTWADLRRESTVAIVRGRVLSRGKPVPHAIVGWYTDPAIADELGNYELHIPYPITKPWTQWYPALSVYHAGVRHQRWWRPAHQEGAVFHQDIELGNHSLTLQFTVRDPDATTKGSGVQVMIDGDTGNPMFGYRESVSGHFRCDQPELTIPDLRAGNYEVSATFPSGVKLVERLRVPATTTVKFEEPGQGTVDIHLVDQHGKPVADKWVWLTYAPHPMNYEAADAHIEGARDHLEAQTDHQGRATLRHVRAGHALVWESDLREDGSRIIVPVHLHDGATVTVTLKP